MFAQYPITEETNQGLKTLQEINLPCTLYKRNNL